MPKLPENIDQLDSFYKEQFENFAPEVSDAVWESVNKNIGQSTGFSVSTPYLLKVAGILLGSLAVVSIVMNSNKTPNTKVIEEIQPIVTEDAPKTEVEEVQIEIETPVIEEKTNPPVVQEEVTTEINQNGATTKPTTAEITEDTTQKNSEESVQTSDFQFVEDLELE